MGHTTCASPSFPGLGVPLYHFASQFQEKPCFVHGFFLLGVLFELLIQLGPKRPIFVVAVSGRRLAAYVAALATWSSKGKIIRHRQIIGAYRKEGPIRQLGVRVA